MNKSVGEFAGNVSGDLMLPPQQLPPSTTTSLPPNFSSWIHNSDNLPLHQPWSLSQILLGGLIMGDEERMGITNHYHRHHKNQHQHYCYHENWEEEASIKQESNYDNGYVIMSSPNLPLNKFSVTTTTTIHNFNEDNKNNNDNVLNLSEYNNSEIGRSSFANKKQKLQRPSLLPSPQSSLKVRKEKLGGRIAALHQIVSPFGKTDTASVLSEAIGYIRFLHSQIEVLSIPYFGTHLRNDMMHQHAQGDMHGLFPKDPGQLVNEYRMKIPNGTSTPSTNNQETNPNEEPKQDLRSRGLCLVPISCTLQLGSDNGADY